MSEEAVFEEVEEVKEEWSLARLAAERPSPSWENVFQECEKTFPKLDEVLSTKTIYPRRKHIFRAFDLCRREEVKVLLLGQDPYPTPGKAVGLSFSIPYTDRNIPGSLQNIFKEIKKSYPQAEFNSGCLIPWAKQGVLLLNSALTFTPGEQPHTELWKHFIVTVLQELSNQPLVAILLGVHAQKYEKYLKSRVKIIKTSHPSGRSAHMGFLGSGCFQQCNDFLQDLGLEPIEWSLPY